MKQSMARGAGDLLDELKGQRILVTASQIQKQVSLVSSGLEELDRVCGGGLPRGCIVEVVAPSCGGGTILYALLAAGGLRGELSVLVDPSDGFDVACAGALGVDLEHLLWVRARGKEEALQAVELILHGKGFGTVVLDLGLLPGRVGGIPACAWMRIKKLASATGTVVVVLSRAGEVGGFASVSVRVQRGQARFFGRRACEHWLAGIDLCFELYKRKIFKEE